MLKQVCNAMLNLCWLLYQQNIQKTSSLFSPKSNNENKKIIHHENIFEKANTFGSFKNQSKNLDKYSEKFEKSRRRKCATKRSSNQPKQSKRENNFSDQVSKKEPRGTKRSDKYTCNECGDLFERKHHLKDHMDKFHLTIKAFNCEKCQKTFQTNDILKEHIEEVHRKLHFKCHDCGSVFISKKEAENHMDKKHHRRTSLARGKYLCL